MMSKKDRTRQQMEEEMRQLRKVFMTVRLMKADEVQGEGYGLTIESEEDVGTEVTIRLPYQQKGDTHAADITGG